MSMARRNTDIRWWRDRETNADPASLRLQRHCRDTGEHALWVVRMVLRIIAINDFGCCSRR